MKIVYPSISFPVIALLLIVIAACSPETKTEDEQIQVEVEEEDSQIEHNSGVITIKGVYAGKNIYVQNPFAASVDEFCVYDVKINEDVSTKLWGKSSAFEVDFKKLGIHLGDSIFVQILHHTCCTPKILNPEALDRTITTE